MVKSTRKRQEAEAIVQEQIVHQLTSRGNESGKTYRGDISAADIIPKHVYEYRDRQLRDYGSWYYRGKSKRTEKQRIELIRYIFAKYKVPQYLENAFISEEQDLKQFGNWYIAAAQGDSLYKTCTQGTLTKKETHYVLQAPNNLSIKEAIWWSKSMAISDDVGVAYKIARSPIARRDYTNEFWIDVHRFFTNNSVSIKELEELYDYIVTAHAEDENWTIKKRSLEAVRRKSETWHRDMIKMRHIGGGSWEGMDVPIWKGKTGKFDSNPKHNSQVEWIIFEILTGNDLAREGNQMRHCIAGYKPRCMDSKCAIFTMRSNTALKADRRHVTIEVDPGGRSILQARGLANRLPKPQERAVLNKWASDRGLAVNLWY